MFSLIDRMLLAEVFKTLLVIIFVIVMLLLGNTLVRFLGYVAEGSVSADIMFLLVGVSLIKTLGIIIPPAFFFSILWVLGRMYRDSEMVALSAVGVGTLRLYRAFLLSALPVTLLVAWLVLDIYPAAKSYARDLKFSQAATVSLSAVQAGEFNEFSRGKVILYAQSIDVDTGKLEGIFVQHEQHGKPGVVTAKQATLETEDDTGHRFIVLTDGYRYQGEPDQAGFAIAHFKRYGLRVPEFDVVRRGLSIGSKPSAELWQSDDVRYLAELQYRLSFPLAVLAFTLISVPLAKQLPREGVYGRLIFAVVLYAVYMNMQKVAESWMAKEFTPAWLGTWWLPLSLAGIALVLIFAGNLRFIIGKHQRRREPA